MTFIGIRCQNGYIIVIMILFAFFFFEKKKRRSKSDFATYAKRFVLQLCMIPNRIPMLNRSKCLTAFNIHIFCLIHFWMSTLIHLKSLSVAYSDKIWWLVAMCESYAAVVRIKFWIKYICIWYEYFINLHLNIQQCLLNFQQQQKCDHMVLGGWLVCAQRTNTRTHMHE